MSLLDLTEAGTIRSFLVEPTELKTAIQKIAWSKANGLRMTMQGHMRSVPRQTEYAADCAAKAEVWDSLLREIESEVKKVFGS